MSTRAKAKAVHTVVYPARFYGVEVAQVTRTQVAKLSAAAKDIVYSKNNRHDNDWVSGNGVEGVDLDPQVQIMSLDDFSC